MRNVAFKRLPAVGLLGLALFACSDPPSAPQEIDGFAAAPGGGGRPDSTCELIKDIASDTRSYFPTSQSKPALDAVGVMDSACKDGNVAATGTAAWNVLALVDDLVNGGNGGDPVVGSRLVNGLVACTKGLCMKSDLEGIDFVPALGPLGLFGVRTSGKKPVVARTPMPFGGGVDNTALWGVESPDWSSVIAGNANTKLIVYGAPNPTAMQLLEAAIGNVQFNLDRFPKTGQFADGKLHVGACFASFVDLPHIDGDNNKPHMPERVQRNSVLLENLPDGPTFCLTGGSDLQHASLFGGVTRVVRNLVSESWRLVFFTDRKVTVIGGTPLDFSTFSAVTARPDGRLIMEQGPKKVAEVGQSIGDIRIAAKSGAGTPMEKVMVSLSVYNNQGEPGGAVLSDTNAYATRESDGKVTISGVSLGKPGGYIICANAANMDDFTFEAACSSLFHVRSK